MIRVFFLIRSLNYGGAERQLITLVRGLDKTRFAITVATFYDGGKLRPDLECIEGIRVLSMHKGGRWDVLPFLWRLWNTVRTIQPHVIYGYMSIANELCLLLGPLVGSQVVWGLRMSNMDLERYDWAVAFGFHLSRLLSPLPTLQIANSYAGRDDYVRVGYAGRRMTVVPNGIDTTRFRPDREAGHKVRAEWSIPLYIPLVGMVGRITAQKDYATFLRAAAIYVQHDPQTRFVCVGDPQPQAYADDMRILAEHLGLNKQLIWIPGRSDMTAVYNSFNIFTLSSSFGEGFPNVIGEAMACAIPCVATDVGDTRWVIGDTGLVVPHSNPRALAGAWATLLASDSSKLGLAARQRVVAQFSVETMVRRTTELIEHIVS